MGTEIERKFLVTADAPDASSVDELDQGYLAVGDDEVRIRRTTDGCVLTVKRGGGLVRLETEIPLSAEDFARLWPLTDGRRVSKTRSRIELPDGLVAELDVYVGDLAGLRTVEVEFPDEAAATAFRPPTWFGADVTEDGRYKNQRLATGGIPG